MSSTMTSTLRPPENGTAFSTTFHLRLPRNGPIDLCGYALQHVEMFFGQRDAALLAYLLALPVQTAGDFFPNLNLSEIIPHLLRPPRSEGVPTRKPGGDDPGPLAHADPRLCAVQDAICYMPQHDDHLAGVTPHR